MMRASVRRHALASLRLRSSDTNSAMRMRSLAQSLLLLCTALGLSQAPAQAEQVVVTSKQPYWAVGERDAALSRECSLGRFNLVRADRLVARFSGPQGAETLGVGKGTGLNLRDPGHLAKPTEDYFFRNQSTTSCEVFVGGRKKSAAAPRPNG